MYIVTAISALAVLAGVLYFAIRLSHKRSTTWTVIGEGQFAKAQFKKKFFWWRGGGMLGVSPASFGTMAKIYFFDGTSCVARDVSAVPCERGALIRVSENGLGDGKVEILEKL